MKTKKETKDNAVRHTSEPWIFAYGSIYQGDNPDTVEEHVGRLAVMDRDNPHTSPCERDENARRICACVNACAGLADPSAVFDVLEALEMIVNSENGATLADGGSILGEGLAELARQAIAKAKGETAS